MYSFETHATYPTPFSSFPLGPFLIPTPSTFYLSAISTGHSFHHLWKAGPQGDEQTHSDLPEAG